MTHIRAALNALAYTTGFALGRVVEAHYRRNLARVVPQPDRETDLDFAKWQDERERDVRKAK